MSGIDHASEYRTIVSLYGVAEEIVATVEHPKVADQDGQLNIIEPLVEAVEEAADVLTTEYAVFAHPDVEKHRVKKTRVEAALRKMFAAIDDYNQRLAAAAEGVRTSARELVDPVVAKLRSVLEEIVVVFLQVVDIALDKIMHKAEAEEMRKRNQRLAALLHQMSLNPV